jgi:dihydroorotase/N-acyl-D-amino-acid deacylase
MAKSSPSMWARALALAVSTTACTTPPTYDVLIAGGRIVDGTGTPWFRGDLAIQGNRIAAIGNLGQATASLRIDASNLVVAPGFIDMLGQSEFNILVDPRAASKITQGITTEITGEGSSIAPVNERMVEDSAAAYAHFNVVRDWRSLSEYFARIDQRTRPTFNIATFVGAGGIRDYVIGKEDRPATADELERMKRLVADAMDQGALGLSSSLQYVPDRFASTDELVALASVAAERGGLYITHQRSESGRIFESIDEVFAIAERAGIAAEIYHLKTAYKANWGKMPEVLARIEAARTRGLDITANMYPYDRASNDLDACLPLWMREGGDQKMIARLKDPADRERAKRDMADPSVTTWENQWYGAGGGDGVLLTSVLNPALRQYEGMTIAEIAQVMGKDPRDTLMDLVLADNGESSCIISIMTEADVREALRHPLLAIGTDSGARAEDGPLAASKSHPRGWGSFPRILGKYVREEKLLTLEEAIRRFTSRPAARVRLTDRGILRPGLVADVTVFDPATIRDVATFENPNHYSVGVKHVFVNGRPVLIDGKMTGERPGRALTKLRN